MVVFACCAPEIDVLVFGSPSLSFHWSWKWEHHVLGPNKAAMQVPILDATFNSQQPSDIKNKQNNPMWPSDIPDAQLPDVLLVMMHKHLVLEVTFRKQECTLQILDPPQHVSDLPNPKGTH